MISFVYDDKHPYREKGLNSYYFSEMKGFGLLNIGKNMFFVAVYCLAFSSCHKATPAGFWLGFRKELIVKNISDQGPNGGKREIFWKSNSDHPFSSQEFIEFAKKNGWQLKDSIFIPFERLKKWTKNNSFPFTYSQFSDSSIVEVGFPVWIETNLTL